MARKHTQYYIQGLLEQWTNIVAFVSARALEAEKIRRLKERQFKLPCRIFRRDRAFHFATCPKRDNHTRIMYENVGVLNDMLDMLVGSRHHQFFYSLRLHMAPYDRKDLDDELRGHLGFYTRYHEDSLHQNVANVHCDLKGTSIDFVLERIESVTPDIKQMVRMVFENHISFEKEQRKWEQ